MRVAILDECIKKRINNIDLLREYTHLRGYHGCRPISIDDYYQKGIKPIEKEFARHEAILRLCDRWITAEKVIDRFNESWNDLTHPHKSVWLTYSEKEFLNGSGHYLIYGSEFLCGIASQLFCQPNLKRVGIPTIFHCNIPLENIPETYLSDINEKIHRRDSSGGFRVYGEVLANEIVGYSQPKTIFDPLTSSIYCYKAQDHKSI